MNYPLDKSEFIAWAKRQPPGTLIDLKLVLLASRADLQIQLQNNHSVATGWQTRARIKLRLTEWRLEVAETLLSRDQLMSFKQAAQFLLDRDTYDTIIEAASRTQFNAARVS